MFGGDPFGNPFQHMQRQMREMDNMMNAMMGDSFGMLGMLNGNHPQQPMLGNGTQRANNMLSPFGGGGLFGGLMQQMGAIQQQAMTDPNSTMFSSSTMISYDGGGQPRIVQSSTRKAGDVMETRHSRQYGDEARMRVGHHIGDREHIIEKNRDKSGRIRQRQQFVNLDEDEAEDFNNEFKARASRHMNFTGRPQPQAIQNGSSSSKDKHLLENGRAGETSAPIITVPDDEEEDDDYAYNVKSNRRSRRPKRYEDENDDDIEYVSSNHSSGPMIREITEDTEESHSANNAKRRKGLFGKFLGSD